MTIIHLGRYDGNGNFEELQADDYEPVEFNDWNFDSKEFIITNNSPVSFGKIKGTWEDITAVQVKIDGFRTIACPLDEEIKSLKGGNIVIPDPIVKFATGDLEIKIE